MELTVIIEPSHQSLINSEKHARVCIVQTTGEIKLTLKILLTMCIYAHSKRFHRDDYNRLMFDNFQVIVAKRLTTYTH